jgi:hypothetical protein
MGRKELQCGGTSEPDILSLKDDTHAALAELFLDAVMGNGLTDHGVLALSK